MSRRAVFVDRDGTIIEERDYLADPAGVTLLEGAAEGLVRLCHAGFAIVVVSNQSGIARGLYGEAEYRAVEAELLAQLEREGVRVLASYHCPHHPAFTGPCECRKPADGLFRLAARDHDLELTGSAFVGDRLRDVAAAQVHGGIGVLVRTGYGVAEAVDAPDWVWIANDLNEAAGTIIARVEAVDGQRGQG